MDTDGRPQAADRPPERPYTVREFAELAGLGASSVYQMIGRGTLPAFRLGGAIRLPREKCDRLLRGEAA
jgi:excisionase family DNA binding protein